MSENKTNSANWWLLWLAVQYATDECFTLTECEEWPHICSELGLPAQADNDAIKKIAQEKLGESGWEWSCFGVGPFWNRTKE